MNLQRFFRATFLGFVVLAFFLNATIAQAYGGKGIPLPPDTAGLGDSGGGNKSATDPLSGYKIIFHHSDHLSGASIDTDEQGNVIEAVDYYPFGNIRIDERTTSYKDNYKFTGQELDENGIYYYDARYYNALIGRFLSQDPYLGDITNPQSLNRYSYVLNNPLKYTDPTGKMAVLAIPIVLWILEVTGAIATPVVTVGGYVAVDKILDYYLPEPKITVNNTSSSKSSSSNAGVRVIVDSVRRMIGGGSQTMGPGGIDPDDDDDPYTTAKDGGRYSKQYQNELKKTSRELENSLKSYEKTVSEHQAKINNPARYSKNWNNLSTQQQKGLLRHWEKDIARNSAYRDIAKGILKERKIIIK